MAPINLLSCLVSDELTRRSDRLLERRRKQAQFRDSQRTLDNFGFGFSFNKKLNRSLVFDLATGAFIARHEDALFLGPPGSGKSHLAQAIGQAAIQQGYRVLFRETHSLLDELAEATLDGTRKEHMGLLVTVSLLIIDDLGMRKLPLTTYWRSSCAATNGQHAADVQSPRRGLGQAAGRRGHGKRYARPPPAPRTCAQMRSPELAHQTDLPPQEAAG